MVESCMDIFYCWAIWMAPMAKLEQVSGGCTNTPSQHHYLMYQNIPSLWHWPLRYKAKSMECSTLTYTYYILFVSHQSIIPNMTFIPQIIKILSKITGPKNIGHWPTYNNEVNLCVTLTHYPTYDIHSSNTLEDINPSHAVRDLSRVRQYPLWLLFTAFVDSVGYPRYNPQKIRNQWCTRDQQFHWLWGWFPDLKIIFMM